MGANNSDTELGNFSIQDTFNFGQGNQELIDSLLEPESAGGNPDDLTPIIADAVDPPPGVNPKPASPKPATEEPPKPDSASAIADFLSAGGDDDDDDPDAPPVPAKGAKITKVVSEEEDDNNNNDSGNSSQFGALAKDLLSLGVFTTNEGEEEQPINTPEEFLERFNIEKQRGSIEMVNNFIGQFGEDYQAAFNAIFVKGADPKEYFSAYNQVTDFIDLDLTQEHNQKIVLREALQNQGFEPDDIESEIERLTNYGDLETVAQRHHKVLVKKQASALADIERKAETELQNKAAIRNEYVTNVQRIIGEKVKEKTFDGIPINPKLASELHDFLLVDKYKTPTGETLTDFDRTILELKRPENHATKVKLGLLLKLLEKDPTLSTIQRVGITNKTNSIFQEVTRQGGKPVQQQKQAAKSWFDQ